MCLWKRTAILWGEVEKTMTFLPVSRSKLLIARQVIQRSETKNEITMASSNVRHSNAYEGWINHIRVTFFADVDYVWTTRKLGRELEHTFVRSIGKRGNIFVERSK